jgi:hypothetical protein
VKLGALNAAIDATPTVYGMTTMGPIALQKGSLKEALKRHFSGGKAQETYRTLNADGVVCIDEEPAQCTSTP